MYVTYLGDQEVGWYQTLCFGLTGWCRIIHLTTRTHMSIKLAVTIGVKGGQNVLKPEERSIQIC